MMKKHLSKIIAVALSATLISFCTVGTAFAYNYYNESSTRYWYVDPTYRSYNAGAFNQMGYYSADCYSWMHITNSSLNVPAGSIMSQAGMSVGNMWGALTMEWGDAVTNTQQNSVLQNVSSTLYKDLNYGEGASAWGYGKVRSSDGTMNEVNSSEIFLIVLTDPGFINLSEGELDPATEWDPDKDNFIGSDGLVYGVPYVNTSGETVMPDMGRVMATNGEVGYINIDSMETAVYNGATTTEGRAEAVADNIDLEARVFQQAFSEYFGIDSLSYEAATKCVTEMRYENGISAACAAIENDTSEEIASAISEGLIADEKAFSVLSDSVTSLNIESIEQSGSTNELAAEITITDTILKDIHELARPQLMVSVPVYSADGLSVIGEYKFGRL